METDFIDQIRIKKEPGKCLVQLLEEGVITADEFDWIYTEIFTD